MPKKPLIQSSLLNYKSPQSAVRSAQPPPSRQKRKLATRASPSPESSSDSDEIQVIKVVSKSKSRDVIPTRKKRKTTRADQSDTDSGRRTRLHKQSTSRDTQTAIRKRKVRPTEPDPSDSSESSDPPPVRKRLVRKHIQDVSEEDEDLDDEVDKKCMPRRTFSSSSFVHLRIDILKNRFRKRGKKTAFQKSLEKLKRKKQGKPIESESESASESDSETASEDNNDMKPLKGAKPHSDHDSLFSGNSDDSESVNCSDFIVEDDGEVPQSLPVQFSMDTHQDLSHQFKKVFQFFVHIAVHPAPERHRFMKKQIRDEEYFAVPLAVVRRKITSIRDSLVASSTWRPKFKKLLETYPEFDLVALNDAVPECEACHLGGRRSTLLGRLSGFPYDPDDSTEKEPKLEFHLGRFCGKRVRVYHELTHWEHALFKIIRDEVDELHASKQSRGFIRVSYAGGKLPPKDLDDADGICEWLDDRKIIDINCQRIKIIMESARHLEMISNKEDD
ncbi:hypothetical protein AMATHDRAFT_78594 [Amanita thiersii Skay4041]|uniref:DUF4211 domain-containing protein n=1 Tax=Amanita thiersii Skay4041 TaxID=703135 RepID=A0A2A9P129_9AGAR|nr:hypothetical protein AMATHDRAFT_78594 [Amanita thiersii Skay4041]